MIASADLTKQEFLRDHPLDENYLKQGKLLDFFARFDLPYSAREIWPNLIDTSRLNRRLGIDEMQFEEVDGKLLGKSRTAGVDLEWEEVPWQWEYLRFVETGRIYSKGFGPYVRANYLLRSIDDSNTALYVYFAWIVDGLLARFLLSAGMPRVLKKYGPTIAELIEERREEERSPGLLAHLPQSAMDSEVNRTALNQFRRDMLQAGLDQHLVDRVAQALEVMPDAELYRIRVKQLASRWEVALNDLLPVFLHGTRAGYFKLTWDVICPHCRGVRDEVQHLGDLPDNGNCEACDIDFDTSDISSFEVAFHVDPSLREVAKRFFCSAEPATKEHIYIQRDLAARSQLRIESVVPVGTYRMRARGERSFRLLEVLSEHEKREVNWSTVDPGSTVRTGAHPIFLIENNEEETQTYVVEHKVEDQQALRPVDLFNFQDFRDLFSAEALASNIQLDVGQQTILFTDIVGSTRFYQARGDHGAFAQVRQHFVELYEIVRKNNGAVVKTIGDAAMAAFSTPVDGCAAAIEMQERFHTNRKDTEIRIRVSLHRGPVLAVNLNSGIDYFGSTVNLAAKLQSVVEAGQVVYSEDVATGTGVGELLQTRRLEPSALDFEWSRGSGPERMRIYRINVNRLPA